MTIQTTQTFQEMTPEATRRIDLAAGGLLVLLTLFRFWYDTQHELLQDEAYYWQWSRHLDWGYYDNTPLMAPVIRLCTMLLGTNDLGVRAGATVCALIAGLFIYLLAKRLLGPTIALVAVVLANIVPLFAAGSVIMTQDPVQLAFWSAALYVIQRALTDRPKWWIGAGILAGLAAQAKLNALLLLPGVFLYLLLSPIARDRWLRRPEPYLAGVIAFVMLAPFFWWNHTHLNAFWIHAHAMSSRGSGHDGLKWVFRFLGDQLVLMSPFVFLTYLYTLYDGVKRGMKERDDALLFLWCPTIVSLAAIIITALKSKVEGNWAVDSYPTGLILVAAVFVRCWESRVVVKRVWVGLSAVLALVLTLAVALFPQLLYSVGVKYPHGADDRTNELYGWRTLGARVTQERAAMGGDPFVFGINYRMPSEAAFYLPGHPQTYALFLNYKASEYLFWEDPKALQGRSAIFLNDTDNQDHFDDLRAVFTRVEPQPPLLVYRNPPYSTPIRTIQIVRCYGFRGYDVKRWQDGW
ncbi:MAG: glycosyltransferase family 39 protein [Janthinobacterium lividum]